MNEPIILNSKPSDLNFMYWMFDEAILYQSRKGFPVWPDYDREILKRDIGLNLQFKVMMNEEIACIFSISHDDKIVWRDKDIGDSIYLHRIVVNPHYKGKKIFGRILEWSIARAITQGLKYIRMDTWANNPTIIDYYKSFGFNTVDYFTNPDTEDMPIQLRGNKVVLMEYPI